MRSELTRVLRSTSESTTTTTTTSPDAPGTGAVEASLDDKIPIPFIVVNTSSETVIQCEMGSDRTDVFFNFTQPFEINDDNEILKRLGMDTITRGALKELLDDEVYEYGESAGLFDGILE